MENPKISIIIPAYNCSKTISKCLESIFNQEFKDFEVIIVDDGSKEDLKPFIKPYEDRIKYFKQENNGAPSARNAGYREAKGEYVIFCDSDIIMRPEMLIKMKAALDKESEAAFAYSSFYFGWKKFKLFEYDEKKLREMPYIHSTSLIRKSALANMAGPWDESLKKFQDWDLFLTIVENGGRGIFLPEFLFKIRTGGTMSSWFPKLFFKSPIKTKKIKEQINKYDEAKKVIKNKHGI